MPSVQVKDFPQDLYDQLKAYSEANHRSMSQQLVVAAEQMMGGAIETPARPGAGAEPESGAARDDRAERRRALFARCDAAAAGAKAAGSWRNGDIDAARSIRIDREGDGRHGGGPGYVRLQADGEDVLPGDRGGEA